MAELTHKITLAERRLAVEKDIPQPAGRYPLTEQQIAWRSYEDRLAQDADGRKQHRAYARLTIDDG
ncbi:hypothetical protein [Thetidibacter halocola]|uniref:hypothetical protein n=1 Tax=Thetidibacter halocola TaxID=2827239 RepID=UPI001BA72889|nr:hypothetical protein [Thetidibacter halocola]